LTCATYLGLAALIGVPAFAKYSSHPFLLVSGYVAVLSLTLVGLSKLVKAFDGRRWQAIAAWGTVCFVLAISNAVLYPRTRIPAARSSAPDALIEPARRMMQRVHPYAEVLFDGAPISPAPAWILVNAPLTLTGLLWLLYPRTSRLRRT
jgi:hypothetical protein